MSIKVTQLESGLRIATAYMPHVETVTLGSWVGVGSRHEPKNLNGITHFIEHMLFKGTATRSAKMISEEVENVGGLLNAYTARERTAYHAKVLCEDVPLALDIIADMLQNSVIAPEELSREADVVIQEIGQAQDTPDDIVFDYLFETAYGDQAIGRPILGSEENVSSFTPDQLKSYIASYYSTGNMVVCAAGKIDHDVFVDLVQKAFSRLAVAPSTEPPIAHWVGGCRTYERDSEQLHFILAYPTCTAFDDKFYVYEVLSVLLGGGMSSRLFQEIREEQGLAYSIYSFHDCFEDIGMMAIYAGTDPEKSNILLDGVTKTLKEAQGTLSEAEVNRAKAQIRAGVRMVLESTSARSDTIASQLLRFGRVIPLSEIEEMLDKVSVEDLHEVLERLLQQKPALVTLGPKGSGISEEMFAKAMG